MRYIRYAFLGTLAVVLISIALANRDDVTLTLLPGALADLLGFNYSITIPQFIVIQVSIAVGVLIGFVWEWTREHKHRADKSKAQRELAKTQRELRRAKGKQNDKQDEVLALLDEAS